MEKRIKILHWLTIVAIVAFCTMQCYWLYNRYVYALESHEEELYKTVLDVMQEEHEARKSVQRPDLDILTRTRLSASSQSVPLDTRSMAFDIYVVDLKRSGLGDITHTDIKEIIKLYEESRQEGISHHKFEITEKPKDPNEYDALERFIVDVRNPFSLSSLDSLLTGRNLMVESLLTEKADTMVWHPSRTTHSSLLSPKITVTYPYDIFEGETVSITLSVGISPVIAKMTDLLVLSFILSILLITCLVAQIATIRKQRKLEELRRDFVHTMIHELKRPVSTLKMCVSYMRNEKLMEDRESKNAVIADSSNELDNLSSYFSKLRDLTFNDATEIPLTLSAFHLRETIEECIGKLSIPSGKKVNINILSDEDVMLTADRMHIGNIISNLLENSVKYSGESVSIEIDYHEDGNESVCITVKDNGIGIAKSESKYIYDKFFRSRSVSDKNIPGIGLGLAYVKQLVQAHKGSIEMESEEGIGTTFTIKLPQ